MRSILVLLVSLNISGAAVEAPNTPGKAAPSKVQRHPVRLPVPASLAPIDHNRVTCALPPTVIDTSPGCARTDRYPACRWHLPSPEETLGTYEVWRNTDAKHRLGRPALVSLVLKTAAAYAEMFPTESLVVGDLDAPGPRHHTHDQGRDVDLYLPMTMWTENQRGGGSIDNYKTLSPAERAQRRHRVLALAQILATCSGGNLRIYYNDQAVLDVFNQWFQDEGYESPFGAPMQAHNALHGFHFHVTVGDKQNAVP